MASAGNIILNLPTGGRGPYRVAPQGTVFRALPSKALQNATAVMGILKQAKDVADMVAPFIGKEYTPPVQQGEIAAQQLDAAQQAAQQLQRTQAIETALATPLPAQVREMAQPLPSVDRQIESMEDPVAKLLRANEMLQEATTSSEVDEAQRLYRQYQDMAAGRPVRGLDTMSQLSLTGQEQLPPGLSLTGQEQLPLGLSTPVSREALRQQAMGMPEAAPLDTAALDPAGLQQLMQQQQTLGAQQDIARAQQAVAEAPPVLPMFNTLAEAEASIRSALMSGNFEEAQRMLAGLEYSPLTDIPRATKIGEIPAEPRRQAAIADMMKRLRIPSELTPARQSLQQQQLDVRQAAIDASRSRTEAMVARAEADRKAKAKLAKDKQAADELKRQQEYERKVTLLGIEQANALQRLETRALTQKELADINNLARLKLGRLQAWSRKEVAKLYNDVRLMTATMQGETAARNRAQRRLNKLLTGNSNAKPDVLKRQLTMMLLRTTAEAKKYGALATGLEGQTGAKLPEIAAKINAAKAAKVGAEKLINLINKKLDSMNATLFRK